MLYYYIAILLCYYIIIYCYIAILLCWHIAMLLHCYIGTFVTLLHCYITTCYLLLATSYFLLATCHLLLATRYLLLATAKRTPDERDAKVVLLTLLLVLMPEVDELPDEENVDGKMSRSCIFSLIREADATSTKGKRYYCQRMGCLHAGKQKEMRCHFDDYPLHRVYFPGDAFKLNKERWSSLKSTGSNKLCVIKAATGHVASKLEECKAVIKARYAAQDFANARPYNVPKAVWLKKRKRRLSS